MKISQEPDYLNNITNEIREFVWNKTFKKAKSELLASKKKMKNSLFAQIISIYFNDLREPV
ncbi:MAG: hypothetical protein HC907_06810 [Richelia sp. SM1_7_0]|nr:hypothetical protein [Richelia sp. SM1_7_0]